MAHFRLIGVVVSLAFLTGCGSTQKDLNATHTASVFESHFLAQREWSVDKTSFAFARAIEILPRDFCGGDYNLYDVFEQNCDGLMTSLFGRAGVSADEGSSPIVLHAKILKVHSKAGFFAFSDADFGITIQFRLTELAPSGERTIAEIATEGRHTSAMGILFCKDAPKRAKLAIQKAFLSAQDKLHAQLTSGIRNKQAEKESEAGS